MKKQLAERDREVTRLKNELFGGVNNGGGSVVFAVQKKETTERNRQEFMRQEIEYVFVISVGSLIVITQ